MDIFREHPEISVGVHLTLNAEWSHYKWGPVAGASKVPSLVDENGHFHPSAETFAAADVNPEEVGLELRAQIERALATGVKIDYLDAHMLMAYSTTELREIVEALAREYGLAISTYFSEYSGSLWDVAPERKLSALLRFVHGLEPGLNLLVIHPGDESPEMRALIDCNNPSDPYRVGQHRQAEIEALTSVAFHEAVRNAGLDLVTYSDIIAEKGLDAMQRPENTSGYTAELD